MGKSSSPATPDYTGAAKATAQGQIEAARIAAKANRISTTTPYGGVKYTQSTTDPDQWSADVTLSPVQQQLLDKQGATSLGLANLQGTATDRVAQQIGQGWDDSSIQGLTSVYDPTTATNNATDLINARLQPQQERDRKAMAAQLANQGLAPGSEAYDAAMQQLGQTQNDAKNQAALSGITLGQQQQQQQYAQGLASHQQGLTDQSYTSNRDINQLNALRTGSQVTYPTFNLNAGQQATTQGADYLGAAQNSYNAALNSSNASNAANSNLWNGLFGLGSAAMMFL